MGRFGSFPGRRRPPPQSPEPLPPLGFERLEPRTLLDASASLTGGLLLVKGGPGKDRLDLSLDAATAQLVVRDAGHDVARFNSASVSQIVVTPGGGAHNVTIAPDVLQPAAITAGSGNVVLKAGGGPTVLTGGSGTNKLIGGPGGNLLIGGSGSNLLIAGTDHDQLRAGTGPSILLVRGNDQLVGVKPGDKVYGSQIPADPPPLPAPDLSPDPPNVVLTPQDVANLLARAAAADPHDDGIVAVVDRGGRLLGVSVQKNVAPEVTTNPLTLSFAIDGAIAEARTGAFFGNDQAPLTSRTIQFISQSTITQREVNSNPNIADPNSTVRGPGFVAPIEIGGHFPPKVRYTPQVDLFNIEGTNRDTTVPLGQGGNFIPGDGRFNVPPQFLPPGGEGTSPPDAYGTIAGLAGGSTQGRGIGTLPGGIPLYKTNPLTGGDIEVGGIGVFFPGKTGYASEENSALSADYNPAKPDRALEAETVAFIASGGSKNAFSPQHPVGTFDFRGPIGDAPALVTNQNSPDFVPPFGRLDLVGITLDVVGPNGFSGPDVVFDEAQSLGIGKGSLANRVDLPVNPQGTLYIAGQAVPEGWLVLPHDGVGVTAADVIQRVDQGIAQAQKTRAAIRLPLDQTAQFVFAVADRTGAIVGLYRMPDATIFSIDVAVAKARNVAYYADPTQLQPVDQLPGIAPGVAFTNRTFRYLAEPFYPEGIDGRPPGPFSILNDGGVDPGSGLQAGPPLPASAFKSVLGHDAFNPETNFRDPNNPQFQNGIVFFPGSAPLYKNNQLIGGFGVSGDGVDQDDVVTAAGATGLEPSPNGVLRSDQVFFGGVRLPYQKFNRQPQEP